MIEDGDEIIRLALLRQLAQHVVEHQDTAGGQSILGLESLRLGLMESPEDEVHRVQQKESLTRNGGHGELFYRLSVGASALEIVALQAVMVAYLLDHGDFPFPGRLHEIREPHAVERL